MSSSLCFYYPATINVPSGKYLIHNAYFNGQTCKSKAITIHIDGTLLAPSDYNKKSMAFPSICGGTFDGQGVALWACKNANKNCPEGTTALTFYNSNNITMSGVTVQNSQKLQGMKVLAQGNSPNTDGIHVKLSSGVSIMKSQIGTRDDCISIGPGTSNLWIEGIACGPGHGISIGSLGWKQQELGVQNVTVKTVTFSGTTNGVRVKTWARPSSGFVRNSLFQHIVMVNVKNPILIDQNYCPNHESCPHQISDVTYQDIRGTSATKIAVKLDCSITNPCRGIILEDLNLSYQNQQTKASCVNARGRVSGLQKPNNCLFKN
ncbi:hypothetical protein R3W88_005034 [Solanum pinnatisectum]|uniref:Polygalacturonase n=1 Tax=Solanum pinnatisectum TaxID=50273 RepID=A0AAV9KB09_9SOLN|nr:hypothetical protein R3W88_005034 [Solanum pinnatisectum]